ncbi:MAG: hypothetical protein ACRDT6_28630, partial [Micromonosporaceae bacterium]
MTTPATDSGGRSASGGAPPSPGNAAPLRAAATYPIRYSLTALAERHGIHLFTGPAGAVRPVAARWR